MIEYYSNLWFEDHPEMGVYDQQKANILAFLIKIGFIDSIDNPECLNREKFWELISRKSLETYKNNSQSTLEVCLHGIKWEYKKYSRIENATYVNIGICISQNDACESCSILVQLVQENMEIISFLDDMIESGSFWRKDIN